MTNLAPFRDTGSSRHAWRLKKWVGGFLYSPAWGVQRISVQNDGPNNAEHVVMTDALPGGGTFFSAIPSQGTCGESVGAVTCNLLDIGPGVSAYVLIVVTPATVGTITNTASVASDIEDPFPAITPPMRILRRCLQLTRIWKC